MDSQTQMALGLISETMDLWSDPNRIPYMAVTSHWIQGIYKETIDGTKLTLKLRADLISFQQVPGCHDGKHLASAFVYITDHVKITDKVRYYCTAVHLLLTQYRLGGSHLTMQPTMAPFFFTWAGP